MSVNNSATNYAEFEGRKLNEFLYEGRPRNNIKKQRTLEECLELLEELRQNAWDNYDDWSKELGWK